MEDGGRRKWPVELPRRMRGRLLEQEAVALVVGPRAAGKDFPSGRVAPRWHDACGTGGFPETAAAIANPARWAYTRYYEEGTPMATRTVRLDAEEERVLEELVRRTRLPVSDVLRRGIRALEKETTETAPRSPFEIYRQLDLGPGGYSNRPATESRRGAREAILRKHRR
jgi:Arc/MetJ-type ribon-helix-helix transcriptional regulator